MAGCWSQAVVRIPASRERGTLRSSDRNLDIHRQPQYWSVRPHGDVARRWQGAGRSGGVNSDSCERGTLRSSDGNLDAHRQPQYCSRLTTRRRCCPMARCWSQAVIGYTGFSRARNSTTRPRELGPSPAASILLVGRHGDVAAQWRGARCRRWIPRRFSRERGTL